MKSYGLLNLEDYKVWGPRDPAFHAANSLFQKPASSSQTGEKVEFKNEEGLLVAYYEFFRDFTGDGLADTLHVSVAQNSKIKNGKVVGGQKADVKLWKSQTGYEIHELNLRPGEKVRAAKYINVNFDQTLDLVIQTSQVSSIGSTSFRYHVFAGKPFKLPLSSSIAPHRDPHHISSFFFLPSPEGSLGEALAFSAPELSLRGILFLMKG